MGIRTHGNIHILRTTVGALPNPVAERLPRNLSSLLQELHSKKMKIWTGVAAIEGNPDNSRLGLQFPISGDFHKNFDGLLEQFGKNGSSQGKRFFALPIYYQSENVLVNLMMQDNFNHTEDCQLIVEAVSNYKSNGQQNHAGTGHSLGFIFSKSPASEDPILYGEMGRESYNLTFRSSLSPDCYEMLLRFLRMIDQNPEELATLIEYRQNAISEADRSPSLVVKSNGRISADRV